MERKCTNKYQLEVFLIADFERIGNQSHLLMHFLAISYNAQIATDGWNRQVFS
jgi:hypothetical protein